MDKMIENRDELDRKQRQESEAEAAKHGWKALTPEYVEKELKPEPLRSMVEDAVKKGGTEPPNWFHGPAFLYEDYIAEHGHPPARDEDVTWNWPRLLQQVKNKDERDELERVLRQKGHLPTESEN